MQGLANGQSSRQNLVETTFYLNMSSLFLNFGENNHTETQKNEMLAVYPIKPGGEFALKAKTS